MDDTRSIHDSRQLALLSFQLHFQHHNGYIPEVHLYIVLDARTNHRQHLPSTTKEPCKLLWTRVALEILAVKLGGRSAKCAP